MRSSAYFSAHFYKSLSLVSRFFFSFHLLHFTVVKEENVLTCHTGSSFLLAICFIFLFLLPSFFHLLSIFLCPPSLVACLVLPLYELSSYHAHTRHASSMHHSLGLSRTSDVCLRTGTVQDDVPSQRGREGGFKTMTKLTESVLVQIMSLKSRQTLIA